MAPRTLPLSSTHTASTPSRYSRAAPAPDPAAASSNSSAGSHEGRDGDELGARAIVPARDSGLRGIAAAPAAAMLEVGRGAQLTFHLGNRRHVLRPRPRMLYNHAPNDGSAYSHAPRLTITP